MALDLGDHLLQAVDALVAALLRNLVLHVVGGALPGVASLLLSLVGDVLASSLVELVSTLLKTLAGIDTRVGTLLLVAGGELSSVGGVTRAARVSGLGSITKSTLSLLLVERLLLVVLGPNLVLKVILGKVGNIVPGVVLGRFVDLVELILGRVDLVGRLLSGITGHVSEENAGIAHWRLLEQTLLS